MADADGYRSPGLTTRPLVDEWCGYFLFSAAFLRVSKTANLKSGAKLLKRRFLCKNIRLSSSFFAPSAARWCWRKFPMSHGFPSSPWKRDCQFPRKWWLQKMKGRQRRLTLHRVEFDGTSGSVFFWSLRLVEHRFRFVAALRAKCENQTSSTELKLKLEFFSESSWKFVQ